MADWSARARVRDGLARGRLLFNRGDFWGSHEAFEQAWHVAAPEERRFLQALVQAAAAFHKLVVQDNVVGATRLLEWSLTRLEPCVPEYLSVDVAGLRNELLGWSKRLAVASFGPGPVLGLPRIEWSASASRDLIRLDQVALHAVDFHGARAVLVSVSADGRTGWGECRQRWGEHGLFDSLAHGLAPALLAQPIAMPGEVGIVCSGAVASRAAVAGVEAALWDLWSGLQGVPLHLALGMTGRSVPLALRVAAGDNAGMARALAAALEQPYEMVVLPARPNADRRVVPGLVASCDRPFALDLGRAYRTADVKALQVLEALGPRFLLDPVPLHALAAAQTLCRWLGAPIALGGWAASEAAFSALELHAADALAVDAGVCGLVQARDMLDGAGAAGRETWVASSAATPVGAAADLALALHPAVCWPADLSACRDASGAPWVRPGRDGLVAAPSEPGLGVTPGTDWLERHVRRRVVLRS